MNRHGDTSGDGAGSQPDPRAAARAMAKQPWSVEIDVYLTKACPDPEFSIHTTLPVVDGKIVFANNNRPGFFVQFNLYDETGGGYTFPPQPKVQEACWSQCGDVCPTSPVWDVLEPRRIENSGATLLVYNDNPSPALGPFQYTLRVTNNGGASYCPLDPGGNDTNGNRTFTLR